MKNTIAKTSSNIFLDAGSIHPSPITPCTPPILTQYQKIPRSMTTAGTKTNISAAMLVVSMVTRYNGVRNRILKMRVLQEKDSNIPCFCTLL